MGGEKLAVVGAGVIGLSVAWRAASRGWSVTVHDPDPARGTSSVAVGMLAPLTEGWHGAEGPLALGAESLLRWPSYAEQLSVDAGESAGLRTEGTLVVAVDSADSGALRELAGRLTERGRAVETLTGREVWRREPALAQGIRSALDVPGDLAVDNRQLLSALRQACSRAGVEFSQERVEDLSALKADQVVLAAGLASAALHPLAAMRPLKGEILRARVRPGALPPPGRTVRGLVHGRHVYLVPRDDGLVIGATQYEADHDLSVTLAGVRDLIADAEAVLPGIAEYALGPAEAGLRPATEDDLPLIGRVDDRTTIATGHGRNGLLLAPLTADAVLAELAGAPLPEVAIAAPGRNGRGPA
ncbi:glycine oxidase ThiO [Saccharopolyspora taberi]|uniref:glycine oxidase n=1 Tax=Saccharopolyspora taberi TaxID=60895 RepID=A0ABN3V012_9PSEU